ncbi:MAG TPA: hypothetical protein VHE99_08320 [Gammaproteobacteria bacterium]|nr:hypothetical protein [Gammaproteobacteria bacterium]
MNRLSIAILFLLYSLGIVADNSYNYSPNIYYGDVSSSFSRINSIQNDKIPNFLSDLNQNNIVAYNNINSQALISYSQYHKQYKIYSSCTGNFLNRNIRELDYGLSIVNPQTGEVRYVILLSHNGKFKIIDLLDATYKLDFKNPPNYQNKPEVLCFGNKHALKMQDYSICAGFGYYTYPYNRFYACYKAIAGKFVINNLINAIS